MMMKKCKDRTECPPSTGNDRGTGGHGTVHLG